MKAIHELHMNRIKNEILEIQIKVMEAKELISDIDGYLESLTDRTFDMMNTMNEMKELTKEFKNEK